MQPKPPLAVPGMRIGLLGGSFNPAHEGHLNISLLALERLGLDRLWWLVTPSNPLKDREELAGFAERLARAGTVAAHPRIQVTSFEAALSEPFYTADTLRFLKARFPGVRFVWVMGGDNLAQIHRWHKWREIFALMPVAVLDRPGARHQALASPAARRFAFAELPETAARALPLMRPPAWVYLTIPLSAASSTKLRRAARPWDVSSGSTS
jgi:nicotinate-nucleotide adenylyltransferase